MLGWLVHGLHAVTAGRVLYRLISGNSIVLQRPGAYRVVEINCRGEELVQSGGNSGKVGNRDAAGHSGFMSALPGILAASG